ncbi:MAG TPA: hypothetical protein PKY31_16680, partial [Spirochaetota bacterium]|nr:hypothetical protein [Spirochaetota bacterium]
MKGMRAISACGIMLLLAAGCIQSLRVHPKSPGESVLYVVRGDAVVSGNDIVKVFLNGKEATSLTYDSYKAMHIRPGIYEIEFRTGSESNLKSALKFSENIPPNSIKFSSVAYNLGWR